MSNLLDIQLYHNLGLEIKLALGLRTTRSTGRIPTVYGDKSLEGLGRTIAKLVHDYEHNNTTKEG